MNEETEAALRRYVGERISEIYQSLQAGEIDELKGEDRAFAEAMQDHLDLPHVHNALEFAGDSEGVPYVVNVNGTEVSPVAHITMHSAVKQALASDPAARKAYDALRTVQGISAHHAEHVLIGLMFECVYEEKPPRYQAALKQIVSDDKTRKRLIEKYGPGHLFAAEDAG
jgi:hypothetical protein